MMYSREVLADGNHAFLANRFADDGTLATKMKIIRLWNFFGRAGLIVRLPQ
jgi:hypothetical protein